MPSPDLPQPIYPNAPSMSGQPQYDFAGHPAEPTGYGQRGGHFQPPQQFQPTPPPPPNRPKRNLQMVLAAGAVVLIAAVVTIVVVVSNKSDNTAGTNGTQTDNHTTISSTTNNEKTTDKNNGKTTSKNNGNNNGTGTDAAHLATVRTTVQNTFTNFSSQTVACIAEPLAQQPALLAGFSTQLLYDDRANAAAFAQIITGCASSNELVNEFNRQLTQTGASQVQLQCAASVMPTWTQAEWTAFLGDLMTSATGTSALNNHVFQHC